MLGMWLAALRNKNKNPNTKTHHRCSHPLRNTSPHEIVCGVYLGSYDDAWNVDLLKRLKIGAVLNVADSEHDTQRLYSAHMPDVMYGGIAMVDSPSYVIERHFGRTNEFIQQARSRGLRILIHCFAGISRSATVLAAYLMWRDGYTAMDAVRLLRQRRAQVQPNVGFMRSLLRYERRLRRDD